MAIKLKLNELTSPHFIWINPQTNTVHLLVPVCSGTEIGLDNTCKTVYSLQSFFGKKSNSEQLQDSARHELLRYKRSLEDDLAILADSSIKNQKLDRLQQVEAYISALEQLEAHPSMNGLSRLYPLYPEPIKELLAAPNANIYGMQLCPSFPDEFLNMQNPIFQVVRSGLPNTLYGALQSNYQHITQLSTAFKTHKERFIDNVTTALCNEVTFPITLRELLPTIIEKLSSIFRQNYSFEPVNFSIDHAKLQSLYEYTADAEINQSELQFLVIGIIANAYSEDSIFPKQSPFTTIKPPINTEKLNLMTQFLLAEFNFYAYAHGHSAANFGAILDHNPQLSIELATTIRTALAEGTDIEQAVCRFINFYRDQFSFAAQSPLLSEKDTLQIATNFAEHYSLIEGSDHFDEFMILQHDKKGGFHSHQGNLCFDFSALSQQTHFERAATETRDMPVILPSREAGDVGSFEIDEPVLIAEITTAIQNNDVTALRRFLFARLENKQIVFEWLNRDFFARFDHLQEKQNLFVQLRRHLNDQTLSYKFNEIVRGLKATQLILTPERARAFYVGVQRSYDVNKTLNLQYTTADDIRALLQFPKITNATVTSGLNGEVVIDAPRETIQQLTDMIDTDALSIHLTPTMAKSIYLQVKMLFGENSFQYQQMNQLSNRRTLPSKLLKALELLQIFIPEGEISFPDQGWSDNGYLIKNIRLDDLRAIETIHAYQAGRLLFNQDMARQLYTKLEQLDPTLSREVNQLSNEETPDKLEATLIHFGIKYQRIEFNETNGYFIFLDEVAQAKLKAIIHSPLSQEETVYLPHNFVPSISRLDQNSPMALRYAQILDRRLRRNVLQTQGQAAQSASINMHAPLAFRSQPIPATLSAASVHLNCPKEILSKFQELMHGTPILGTSFQNPCTHQLEHFPSDVKELTARHLQILARNESANVDGIMKTALYNNLLTPDQIATLRCFVKFTTITGITFPTQYGGYPSGVPTTPLPNRPKTIVIDQSGLQWQGDFRNSGGLIFFPTHPQDNNLPAGYLQWQNKTFADLFGFERPQAPSQTTLPVHWNGVAGILDLEGVEFLIRKEFEQALEAAVAQGNANLGATERINFKFLKAGMGYFASGLHLNQNQQTLFEGARLQGILSALTSIQELDPVARQAVLGKIGRIELPFNSNQVALQGIALKIGDVVKALDLEWGNEPNNPWSQRYGNDAYAPRDGWVNATTNCGDPHAMIGNEGGHRSVDAALATNAYLDHLNAAYNKEMQLRESMTLYPIQHPLMAVAPPTAAHTPIEQLGNPLAAPSQTAVPMVIPQTQNAPRLQQPLNEKINRILTELIENIQMKNNNRSSWFTVGITKKTTKLSAIRDWLQSNSVTEQNKTAVLALIKDICAIKRNYVGFMNPHSLNEFYRLLSIPEAQAVKSAKHTLPSDLATLNGEDQQAAVTNLIQQITQGTQQAGPVRR